MINPMLLFLNMAGCNSSPTPMAFGTNFSPFYDEEMLTEVTSYKHLDVSLIYLSTTRSDIYYATGFLARYMHKLFQVSVPERCSPLFFWAAYYSTYFQENGEGLEFEI